MLDKTELQYLLQTQVPRHWIPMVPIAAGVGTIALRKGTMANKDLSLGVLLDPTPLTIRHEEIPREGVQVRRVPALARDATGLYLRWIARRVRIGRGEKLRRAGLRRRLQAVTLCHKRHHLFWRA